MNCRAKESTVLDYEWDRRILETSARKALKTVKVQVLQDSLHIWNHRVLEQGAEFNLTSATEPEGLEREHQLFPSQAMAVEQSQLS